MKRKIIFTIISLIIIGAAAYFYVDTVFLPVQFKRFLTSKVEKLIDRQVSIGAIDFKPFHGLILKNVTIFQIDDPDQYFFKSKEITFNLLLVPFFQKKAIIIPNIRINGPIIRIARSKKGVWNFSDLLDSKKTSGRKDLPPILLRKLNLENGTIHFSDEIQKEKFTESIENIHLNTTLSLNKGIRFIAQAHIPELKSTFKIKGNHNIVTKKLTAQVTVKNFHPTRYLALIDTSQHYVQLNKGIISTADLSMTYQGRELQLQGSFDTLDTNILVGQNKQISGNVHVSGMFFTWSGGEWDVQGQMKLPDLRMTSVSGKEFHGNVTADLNSLIISGNNITSEGNVTIDDATLKIDDHRFLKGIITATNASFSKIGDALDLKGSLDARKAVIVFNDQVSLEGNLSTTKTKFTWSSPDSKGNRTLNVESDLNIDSANLILGIDRYIRTSIIAPKTSLFYDQKKVTVEIQGQLNETLAQFKEDQQFQGNPHFNIFYQYDFNSSNPLDYKGTLHLTKSQLSGIPIIEKISAIEGTINIAPDQIETNGLTFNTQGTNIHLSGLLTDFEDLDLDIKASSERVDLENILDLFPVLSKIIKADITGLAAVKINYKGPALSPSDANIQSTAQITAATFMSDNLDEDITNISGQLEYKTDLLIWRDLLVNYKNRSYAFNGQLDDFSRPVIDTTVTAEQLSLTARIKILHQSFQLSEFTCDYLNSYFDLKGDVHFFEDADANIDLRGKVAIDLRDINMLVPRLRSIVQPFDLSGVLTGEGLYRGKLSDWRNWQLVFDAQSNKIMINDHPFKNVSIQFAQRDQTINKYNISSMIYDGTLNITSSADLQDSEVPFTATLVLENLDLQHFRDKQKPKLQKLAGMLNISSELQGEGKKWRQLTGNGSFSVSEGYLWQWNVLNGISSILLIPEFKSLAFTEANGSFFIGDQKFTTSNTRIFSTSATLTGKGWIDFNKNINFDISPNFSELAIHQSNSIKKKPTSILTQTDGYINIKLTGTLDNPRFSVKKFPMKIIEETIGGTTGVLKEVIGSIIDEIF